MLLLPPDTHSLFLLGKIDRDEWNMTVRFYLELKREEKLAKQDADEVTFELEAQQSSIQRKTMLAMLGSGNPTEKVFANEALPMSGIPEAEDAEQFVSEGKD